MFIGFSAVLLAFGALLVAQRLALSFFLPQCSDLASSGCCLGASSSVRSAAPSAQSSGSFSWGQFHLFLCSFHAAGSVTCGDV